MKMVVIPCKRSQEYSLSQAQADALLDISFKKLPFLETKKFLDERKSLSEQISKFNELLSSKKHIFQVIEQEAFELKTKFGTSRLSLLEDGDGVQLEDKDVIPNEEMLLKASDGLVDVVIICFLVPEFAVRGWSTQKVRNLAFYEYYILLVLLGFVHDFNYFPLVSSGGLFGAFKGVRRILMELFELGKAWSRSLPLVWSTVF
ncbi:hypothetical protein HPP92_019017 [Vanilla planifolia]|uniref:DNA topoisomerase (ATP-hydrolyzing) n=1 Tax=Vanilla planifolia TaxID=51239 RepID=A0A835UMT3_VANPL|nr:hypothetical protein HPP92_019017 [Vanilla planifolia]